MEWIVIKLFLTFQAADFLSGVFHWIEDSYLDSKSIEKKRWLWGGWLRNYLMQVADENEIHHKHPTDFCRYSELENLLNSIPLFVAATSLLLIWPSVYLWIFLNLSLFSNLVHRWNHSKPPFLICILQMFKVIQTPDHHKNHHYDPETWALVGKKIPLRYYCVLGNLMNPVLDYVGFWRTAERVVDKILKVKTNYTLDKFNTI
jgi:ubiquitin-conjugating enzyme E2 variant